MEDTLVLLERKRRWNGLVMGLVSGLLFGLLSQGSNYLALSGISLYQPPFGPVGNTLMFTAIGGILGLITCWSGGSVFGVLMGSLVAGLMLIASALLSTNLSRNLGAKVVGLVGFYLPFAASVVPLLALLRIAVNQQRDYIEYHALSWKRLRLPLLLSLIMVLLGLTFLFPPEGQHSVQRMDLMIRAGLAAGGPSALPAPLQDARVGPFTQMATAEFTIQLDTQNLIRYQIPYAPRAQWQPYVVVARFSSGWSLACLYISPEVDPFCKGYEDLAAFLQ